MKTIKCPKCGEKCHFWSIVGTGFLAERAASFAPPITCHSHGDLRAPAHKMEAMCGCAWTQQFEYCQICKNRVFADLEDGIYGDPKKQEAKKARLRRQWRWDELAGYSGGELNMVEYCAMVDRSSKAIRDQVAEYQALLAEFGDGRRYERRGGP